MIMSLGESSLAIDGGSLTEAMGLCMDCGIHNTSHRIVITEYIYFVFYDCPSGGYMTLIF